MSQLPKQLQRPGRDGRGVLRFRPEAAITFHTVPNSVSRRCYPNVPHYGDLIARQWREPPL